MEYKQETKNCQNCKKDFVIEPDDFGFYEKIGVPPPTFCPECRLQRRLAWRNTYNLYNLSCNLCGKNTISIYSPNSNLVVYCVKCFWSDNWDPYKYGQDFDFSKSFFEQYMEVNRKVPKIALVNDDGVASLNSPYCHDFGFSKNCYMTFIGWKLENVLYSCLLNEGRELCDCLGVQEFSEFIYESILIDKCYKCRYVQYGSSLQNCDFCYDCRDCNNCFMCFGLRSKKYCYQNKEYSKEEYEKILESYAFNTRTGWAKAEDEFKEFILKCPRRFAMFRNSVNCTGNDLIRAKHTRDSFYASLSEESRYVVNGVQFKDCYDSSGGGETEYCYETITPDHSYNNFFSIYSWKNKDIAYCENCHSCNNIFGCSSLKKGEYSILNKRYFKEEYFILKNKIIEHMKKTGEWGEFFPASMSHFGYNETEALDLYPLSYQEINNKGFKWQNNLQHTVGKETILQKNIPDNINNVNDSIINEVLVCELCNRNYKITQQELVFYKRMSIPIPRFCFFCRNNKRINLRNPFKLWHRKCMKEGCQNEFETSYAPDRPEIIYCEQCYNKEVY
jgi:uncharacterized protein YbaR (Trm112 family)